MRQIVMAAALAMIMLHGPVAASSQRLTYERFQGLNEQQRSTVVQQLARMGPSGRFEIQLSGYHVLSDLTAEQTVVLAIKMDEFYTGFSSIFTGRFINTSRPKLYASKDAEGMHRDYLEWSGRPLTVAWAAGLFSQMPNGQAALFGSMARDEESMYTILYHEGTHHLLTFYLGRRPPVWFNEGTATNFENWDVNNDVERNLYSFLWRSGRPDRVVRMMEGEDRPSALALMSLTSEAWNSAVGEQVSRNYGEAFVLLNQLLTMGELGQRNMNFLIAAFRRDSDTNRVIPLQTRQQLHQRYLEHIADYITPHVKYSRQIEMLLNPDNTLIWRHYRERARQQVTRLDEATRLQAAKKLLEEALEKHPDHAELRYYSGLVLQREGKTAEALDIYKPLISEQPRHPHLYRQAALAYAALGDRTPEARRVVRRAAGEDLLDSEVRALLPTYR